MLPDSLLEGAVKFHGHLGPFLVLGLRAGLLGLNHLGRREGLGARVETEIHPPRSCFIDGIQFASGCTIGKGTLEVRAGNNVSVEFVRGDRSIGLVVRDNILRTLDHLVSKKQLETLSREILEKNDYELFLILTD